MKLSLYTCPCCGHVTFEEAIGSDEICGVCYWQDDALALRYPNEKWIGSATLVEAQKNFARFGACEERLSEAAKNSRAKKSFEIDPLWRPIDLSLDKFDETDALHPKDETRLYYWLPTYWLHD